MKEKSKSPERTLNKKMLERLIIIHNAIKAGMYPDVQKLQKLTVNKPATVKLEKQQFTVI